MRKRVDFELAGLGVHRLDIERRGPREFTVQTGTAEAPLEQNVRVLRDGSHPVVLVDGVVVSVAVQRTKDELWVCLRNAPHRLRPRSALDSRRPGGRSKANDDVTVNAPMPGRVVQVHVAAGDSVKQGAPLLVIEAMKMQNALFSPRDGRIARLHVADGQSIERGAPLVEFELTSAAES